MVTTLHRAWRDQLATLVESAERRLVLAAPFISAEGARLVLKHARPSLRESGRIEILTDLSPSHVCYGSLDPEAVVELCRLTTSSSLWHIPRFHAKVYIADDSHAIVTSGNLTASALYRNTEYGVQLDDHETVAAIQSHFDDFRVAGTNVELDDLLEYSKVASEIIASTERHQETADPRLRDALQKSLNNAQDRLIRMRLAGGAIHTVFAKTVHYLLTKYGAMSTIKLHGLIQELHPDLCDDTVDRVINGERYGKKWKHAVRTAQQQLKRAGIIEYSPPIWRLVSPEKDVPR